MASTSAIQNSITPAMSRPLRAIITIASANLDLQQKLLPYISISDREVDWPVVFTQDFSHGNLAAVNWAYAIWTNESAYRDPFALVSNMDVRLKLAVIRALLISWGLDDVVE